MCDTFSASGFFVQTPCGPRKSGMPDSVEMPAPVSTTMRDASSTQRFTSSRAAMSLVFVVWIGQLVTRAIVLIAHDCNGARDSATAPKRKSRRPRCRGSTARVTARSRPRGLLQLSANLAVRIRGAVHVEVELAGLERLHLVGR